MLKRLPLSVNMFNGAHASSQYGDEVLLVSHNRPLYNSRGQYAGEMTVAEAIENLAACLPENFGNPFKRGTPSHLVTDEDIVAVFNRKGHYVLTTTESQHEKELERWRKSRGI